MPKPGTWMRRQRRSPGRRRSRSRRIRILVAPARAGIEATNVAVRSIGSGLAVQDSSVAASFGGACAAALGAAAASGTSVMNGSKRRIAR